MGKIWALYKNKKNGYYYQDEHRNESDVYAWARPYLNGFGTAQLSNGNFVYIDKQGVESEEFADASSYSDGFGTVKKLNRKYAYRDRCGNLSEEYLNARAYLNGFGEVELNDGSRAYRDILGNISQSHTQIGKEAFEYYSSKIDEYDLSDEAYADERFLNYIIRKINNMSQQSIELASTKEELEKVRDHFDNLIEYVKSRAYEAYESEKEKERLNQLEQNELVELKKQITEGLGF